MKWSKISTSHAIRFFIAFVALLIAILWTGRTPNGVNLSDVHISDEVVFCGHPTGGSLKKSAYETNGIRYAINFSPLFGWEEGICSTELSGRQVRLWWTSIPDQPKLRVLLQIANMDQGQIYSARLDQNIKNLGYSFSDDRSVTIFRIALLIFAAAAVKKYFKFGRRIS